MDTPKSNPVLEAVEHYAFLRYVSCANRDEMESEWLLDMSNAIDSERSNCYTSAYLRADEHRHAKWCINNPQG